MKFADFLNFLTVTVFSACLFGCGLFTDDTPPEENSLLEIEAIFGNQRFDPKKFYQFFEEPISSEIDYIENRLYDYAKYVIQEETNTISRNDLKFFVSEFFRDQAADFHRGIDTIFAVNSVFFGTGYDRLSLENIERLFVILRRANIHFSTIARAFQDYSEKRIPLADYRRGFEKNLSDLSQTVMDVVPSNVNASARIAPLIQNFAELVLGNNLPQEDFRNILSDIELVKVLVLGGDSQNISLEEIRVFMRKFVGLALPLFDLYYLADKPRPGNREYVQFIGGNIKALFNALEMSSRVLSKYRLKKFFNGLSDNLPSFFLNAVNLFLEGSSLFSGEEKDSFTVEGLEKTFHIFYEGALVYTEGIEHSKEKRENKDDLKNFKEWFIDKTTYLSQIILDNISSQKQSSLHIDESLISHATKTFRSSSSEEVRPKNILKRIQLLKVLLAGGERGIITTREMQILAEKASQLSKVFFDFLYFGEYQLEKNFEYTRFVVERVHIFLNAIEEQTGSLFYPDELVDIFPQSLGRWTSTEVISFIKKYKTILLQEEGHAYTYRNVKQAENTLAVYLESFILYEYTYKTMVSIFETETATREDIASLRNRALTWKNNVKAVLDLSLYPEEIKVESFIRQTWKELKFTDIGTEKFLGILSSKKFLEATPKDILYKKEVPSLIEKVPPVLSGVLTIVFNFTRENDLNKIYFSILQAVREIRGQFRTGNHDDIFLEMNDLNFFELFFAQTNNRLIKLVKTLVPIINNKIILELYYPPRNTIDYSQDIYLSSIDNRTKLTFSEFNNLFNIIDDILIDLSLAGPTFDFYKDELEVKTSINSAAFFGGGPLASECPRCRPDKNLDVFSFFTEEQVNIFLTEFSLITSNYKYFRNDSGIHIYDEFYHRTKMGYIEILFLKKICSLLIRSYGKENGRITPLLENTLDAFLWDFKPLFDYFDAWTDSPKTFARNIVRLSDLFQHSSNGNEKLDLNEIVEFVGLTISAMKIRGQVLENIASLCENFGTLTQELIGPSCYKKHFFTVFFEDFPYLKDHLPKLYRYISGASSEEKNYFLTSMEGFSRGKRTDLMKRRHFNSLFGSMLNIESTFIRYDKNNDNILDEDDLYDAFPTYKRTLYSTATNAGLNLPYDEKGRVLFLYIINNNRPPQQGLRGWLNLLEFSGSLVRPVIPENIQQNDHQLSRLQRFKYRKAIIAKRIDIGAILYYIANPSNEDQTDL